MAKRKTVKILTNEDKKKHLAKTKKAIDEGFIVTKEKINENISTFVNSMESGDLKTTEKVFKDMAGNYKEAMDKADIKKSDVDGEKAGKTSNED